MWLFTRGYIYIYIHFFDLPHLVGCFLICQPLSTPWSESTARIGAQWSHTSQVVSTTAARNQRNCACTLCLCQNSYWKSPLKYWIFSINSMVIFHSYVSLPEGSLKNWSTHFHAYPKLYNYMCTHGKPPWELLKDAKSTLFQHLVICSGHQSATTQLVFLATQQIHRLQILES